MPIYEYECANKNCVVKIECLQKITDEPLKICPGCKEQTLYKVISAAGFRLKGSGWYETDFKNNKTKKENLTTDNQTTNSKVEQNVTTTKSVSQTTEG